jgi:hypothetical protein
LTVTFVLTTVFPKKSVAVHVIVVMPIGKMFPGGTPVRVTGQRPMLSVPVAVPMVLSLRYAVGKPESVDFVRSGGTESVGGTLSTALTMCVPTWTRVLSNDPVPVIVTRPTPPSTTSALK